MSDRTLTGPYLCRSLVAVCALSGFILIGALKSVFQSTTLVLEAGPHPSLLMNMTNIYNDGLNMMNTGRIMFNRVPKCGSELTMNIFSKLSKSNGWRYPQETTLEWELHHRKRLGAEEFWTDSNKTLKAIARTIMSRQPPVLVSMHIHYLNFSRYSQKPEPIFINVIRDPLDRLVSWYYYIRYATGHRRLMSRKRRDMTFDQCVLTDNPECTSPDPSGFFTLVPYFCGHDVVCRSPSQAALNQAQKHVMRHLVVGLLEHYDDFLLVLENLLPAYFEGATNVYKTIKDGPSKGKKNVHKYKTPAPSPEAVNKMKRLMAMEYEFYNFVKQRFSELKRIVLERTTNRKQTGR